LAASVRRRRMCWGCDREIRSPPECKEIRLMPTDRQISVGKSQSFSWAEELANNEISLNSPLYPPYCFLRQASRLSIPLACSPALFASRDHKGWWHVSARGARSHAMRGCGHTLGTAFANVGGLVPKPVRRRFVVPQAYIQISAWTVRCLREVNGNSGSLIQRSDTAAQEEILISFVMLHLSAVHRRRYQDDRQFERR
jgi:hypothetical protein